MLRGSPRALAGRKKTKEPKAGARISRAHDQESRNSEFGSRAISHRAGHFVSISRRIRRFERGKAGQISNLRPKFCCPPSSSDTVPIFRREATPVDVQSPSIIPESSTSWLAAFFHLPCLLAITTVFATLCPSLGSYLPPSSRCLGKSRSAGNRSALIKG